MNGKFLLKLLTIVVLGQMALFCSASPSADERLGISQLERPFSQLRPQDSPPPSSPSTSGCITDEERSLGGSSERPSPQPQPQSALLPPTLTLPTTRGGNEEVRSPLTLTPLTAAFSNLSQYDKMAALNRVSRWHPSNDPSREIA